MNFKHFHVCQLHSKQTGSLRIYSLCIIKGCPATCFCRAVDFFIVVFFSIVLTRFLDLINRVIELSRNLNRNFTATVVKIYGHFRIFNRAMWGELTDYANGI